MSVGNKLCFTSPFDVHHTPSTERVRNQQATLCALKKVKHFLGRTDHLFYICTTSTTGSRVLFQTPFVLFCLFIFFLIVRHPRTLFQAALTYVAPSSLTGGAPFFINLSGSSRLSIVIYVSASPWMHTTHLTPHTEYARNDRQPPCAFEKQVIFSAELATYNTYDRHDRQMCALSTTNNSSAEIELL